MAAPPPASRQGSHQHRVLVVEDYDDARSALAMALEVKGCEVASVADGEGAVDWLQDGIFLPCVIVLDLILPKMDGVRFRDWQRDTPNLGAIPVIALTGHEGMRRHASDNGFAAALLKPAGIDDLVPLLDRHCRATMSFEGKQAWLALSKLRAAAARERLAIAPDDDEAVRDLQHAEGEMALATKALARAKPEG